MSFGPQVTATGIIIPTYQDVLAFLKQEARRIYGQDIYLESDSEDGQLLAVFAKAINECNQGIVAAYNAFSPATAQGAGLSNMVKINGIRRLVPSRSTAAITISGTAGTQIENGVVGDNQSLGTKWALPALVTIPSPAATITVTATCTVDGAVAAGAHTLTEILTPTRGWQAADNDADAAPGLPVEDDATLRERQGQSTAIPALSVKGAILGAIENITGVGRAYIYENDTGTTDANGIPAHSIACVVQGGDVDSIGAAIARYKTPGTRTYGDTDVIVDDPIGVPNTIHFYELSLIIISTVVLLDEDTGYITSTADLIAASLAAWFNSLAIGQDSVYSKLWSPVNLTGDAAVDGTGLAQGQLDLLGDTYSATAIYQAREDMVVTGGPVMATATDVTLVNADAFTIGKAMRVKLDNNAWHVTTVANKVGSVVTMANAVPGGRNIPNDRLVYVSGDLTLDFNEAASATAADCIVIAS